MDLNDIRSGVTLAGFALFFGLVLRVWWPKRRAAYEAAAQLPFEGDAAPVASQRGRHE
ncbi:MAG TPA: cbb3-type cytochrome c oxidase subunit 3 [Ideonella sp.]|jgi:cytochrome c oxidase cbb3-type subunit IV|uniref:cbb3-type cytochrome oxidase subunit 3 n=1 Tax=Ideonella sp. TaxID=1929293 RepID=UPI002E318BEE|nr:cbb3-type cytochrome c oxidase subunit 3 [Ideonella sp.]HEX5687498.1 cbb3-type cytochrome c oxidase subunit 3 [Ideonella sp.]